MALGLYRQELSQLTDIHRDYLNIHSPDVLKKIGPENSEWETMVPAAVAEAIKSRHLFGYR